MPAALPYIGAVGSLAGGAAQLAHQPPPQVLKPQGGATAMPSGDAFQLPTLQQLSAPGLPQVNTDYGRQPIPQSGADYDRNLMTILNAMTKESN